MRASSAQWLTSDQPLQSTQSFLLLLFHVNIVYL